MIIGVGNDLVEMRRLQQAIARHPRLPEKILTAAEREEYAARQFKLSYLAGRMAAKEALSKALSGGMRAPMGWRQTSVLANNAGRPIFHFVPSLAKMLEGLGVSHCHLSITHDGGLAAALVIAENTGERI